MNFVPSGRGVIKLFLVFRNLGSNLSVARKTMPFDDGTFLMDFD
jgi:hypothetical protein